MHRGTRGLGDQLYHVLIPQGLGQASPGPLMVPAGELEPRPVETTTRPSAEEVARDQDRQWLTLNLAPLLIALVPALVGYGLVRWRVGSHWSELSGTQHVASIVASLAAGAVGGIAGAGLVTVVWRLLRGPIDHDTSWSLLGWWILFGLGGAGLTAGATYATLTR